MKYLWRGVCSKCDIQLEYQANNVWICGCEEE